MLSIRFGVVRLVVRCVRTARGFWGHAPSENFLEFMGYEVASETISGPKRCFSEARRQSFTCMNIYPFCLLRHIDLALVSAFRSFANFTSHTLRRSLGRTESCWKARSFALFAAISYYVATCHHAVCVPWAFVEHWPYLATPSKPW